MAAAKKKKTKKLTKKQKTQKEQRTKILRRVGIVGAAFILCVWAMSWFILSGGHIKTADWMKGQALNLTQRAGFEVNEILVEGRKNTNAQLILTLINVGKGDPIFLFNPQQAKSKIEEISWVERAHIERRLPDTIYIGLTEREPFALWHNDDVLSVVDIKGTVITSDNITDFKDLMMIRGDHAAKKAKGLFQVLSGEKALHTMIDHAELVDQRRWDLILKDGKKIKLPEKDIAIAIKHVMKRDEKDGILGTESITDIDARYKGRLIVRTKLGTVQDFISNSEEVGTHL